MSERKNIELLIVTESAVRDYAESQLPEEDHEAIEDTLLEDDRARRLVDRHAPSIASQPVAEDLQRCLLDALSSCQGCVATYELLSRVPGPETLAKFARSRFSARWKLLHEMAGITKAYRGRKASVFNINDKPAEKVSVEDIVFIARENDILLAEALHEAFEATQIPAWKAQLAEWISAIRDDMGQIFWLKSAFGAPERAGA